MADVITYAMSGAGPYQSTTINNGGVLVGSPQGSGFLDTNYTFGGGYNGADTTASALPATGTVYSKYDTRITGCPPCS
jgi:hypothetical protein